MQIPIGTGRSVGLTPKLQVVARSLSYRELARINPYRINPDIVCCELLACNVLQLKPPSNGTVLYAVLTRQPVNYIYCTRSIRSRFIILATSYEQPVQSGASNLSSNTILKIAGKQINKIHGCSASMPPAPSTGTIGIKIDHRGHLP